MSGVIDEDGTQWEHCNNCCDFVRIQDLCYEQPSARYDCGRDLCAPCSNAGPYMQRIRAREGQRRHAIRVERAKEYLRTLNLPHCQGL